METPNDIAGGLRRGGPAARSLGLVALFAALLVAACAEPRDARSEGATTTAPAQDPTTTTTDTTTTTTGAAAPATYAGLPTGFTEEGHPYLGDVDAPVTLVEFSDYLCPFCARHFEETTPSLLETYGRSGDVLFVFRDYPLVGLHPTAPAGHSAALCVAEQGAPLFWAMHDRLFEQQSSWSGLADPAGFLASAAEAVGADPDQYGRCVASGRTAAVVDQQVGEGAGLGFTGTPSFLFVDNGTGTAYPFTGAQPLATFEAWLDALLAGEEPPGAAGPDDPPAQLPLWASPEGLAPDSERPGFNLAGDPYKGDPEAPVVVVEFSDYQCPFCRRHVLETQPLLDEQFVDAGEILWVFKDFPLPTHPQATVAAMAAGCAGDQGAFWEMHDLIFEEQDAWAVDPPEPILVELAGRLGLDTDLLARCLDSRAALEAVLGDVDDAGGLISSTPSFVVLTGNEGRIIEGAIPAEDFIAFFSSLLGAR